MNTVQLKGKEVWASLKLQTRMVPTEDLQLLKRLAQLKRNLMLCVGQWKRHLRAKLRPGKITF